MTKICPPYKDAKITDITQKFGVNPLPYQPNGHTGVDFALFNGYGKWLVAPEKVFITNVINGKTISDTDYNDLNRGYGVVMKSTTTPDLFYIHWHCLPEFPVNIGDIIEQGKPVAQMGNSGNVFFGGTFVPLADRTKNEWKGTHDHFEMFYDKANQPRQFINPLPLIDFTIPINYDLLTAIKATINNIFNIFRK